jgi:hypothetical protein
MLQKPYDDQHKGIRVIHGGRNSCEADMKDLQSTRSFPARRIRTITGAVISEQCAFRYGHFDVVCLDI